MEKLKSKKFFKPLCICLIVVIALGILGCAAVFGIDAYVRVSTRDRILTQEQAQKLTDVDCIVVLGCLVRDDGTPATCWRIVLSRALPCITAVRHPS